MSHFPVNHAIAQMMAEDEAREKKKQAPRQVNGLCPLLTELVCMQTERCMDRRLFRA